MSDAEETDASGKAGDFLNRWSQRKTACRKDEAVAAAAPAAQSPLQDATTTVDSEPRQELMDADMPSIDSLDSNSDFSVFMSPKVSEQLRTLALRKLFHMPAFNVTDGLNDYDEDYTGFAGLGNVVTHEMKRMLQRELHAEDVAEGVAEDEPPPVALAEVSTTVADEEPESVEDKDEDSGNA